jgi:catechol 2,3-dioxygenase-like lactoylglutathione lyase family enzyme
LVFLLVPGAIPAGDAVVPEGFHEVVFSVSDLEGSVRFYRDVAGWEVVHRGRAGSGLADFWKLDDGQEIKEIVLANPGEDHGFLRLVAFPGAEQGQIRSSAQTWDTGGIFDVNVRVKDIHEKFGQLRKRGWQFYSDPLQFHFGPFVVWEALARGPDGIVIAMVERVEPPLEGWPNLREFSRIFNSTQIVRDFDRSRAFYEETLGFQVYLEHVGPSKEAGPNVLGLPHNLANEVPRRVVILSPDGTNSGSVELIGFDGLTGADFSEHAVPPNLGILALRFPVADLEAYRVRLAEHGVGPINGPSTVTLEPYGEVEILTVRAPEGAWLEFYQPPDAGGTGVEEDR